MFSIPYWLIGIVCLLLGLFFTFVAPPGRRATLAFLDEAAVFLLFVVAAYCLWPNPQGWNWLLPGLAAGIIALLIIEFRRFTRYFVNLQHRMNHPYFWYSKFHSWSRRRRRN